MKKLVIILGILLAAVTGGWLFSKSVKAVGKTAENDDSRSFVATAETRDIEFKITVSGDVSPASQLEIKSEVGGKVIRLHVIAGQEVQKGDPLVDIDDTELLNEKASVTTEIEGAQLQVDRARRNFERAEELHDSKLISREVYDNLAADLAIAENSLVKAERKLQTVEDKLQKTRIFAPDSGTVLDVAVLEGQVVVPAASVNNGTTLLTLANLSSLLVDTHINQVDVSKIHLDQVIRLTGETVKSEDTTARIKFIAPVASVKNNVKGFAVQAVIENPDVRLRPGMTVMMDVPVAAAEEAVSVPISAVFKEGNETVVYVVEGDTTETREVVVGVSNLEFAEIRSGLKIGETILMVQPKLRSSNS